MLAKLLGSKVESEMIAEAEQVPVGPTYVGLAAEHFPYRPNLPKRVLPDV
jgi:hypothetical protein